VERAATVIADALRISLSVTVSATVLVIVVGIAIAWRLARRRFTGRDLLESLLVLPLVLPPTVTGYTLIALLGRRGPIGEPLEAWTGVTIPFTWAACVIAAAVMAFPLMLRSAIVAFEEIDPRLELAASSLGHGRASTFFRVVLPCAKRGLVAGAILAFARALGEFGATLMLAGNIPGRTQTLPLAIYDAALAGEDRVALVLALVLTAVSLAVMLASARLVRGRN
jgi:molybdate transport system permease protein